MPRSCINSDSSRAACKCPDGGGWRLSWGSRYARFWRDFGQGGRKRGRRETQKPRRGRPRRGFTKSGDDLLSRCSHYHRPWLLNGRVRNGNGCGQPGMVTGKSPDARLAAVRRTARFCEPRLNEAPVYQLVAIRSCTLHESSRSGLRGGIPTPPAFHARARNTSEPDPEKDQCGQAFGC